MFCPSEWRALAARVVLEHPERYPESILGKATAEYAEKIQRDTTWGGEIECNVVVYGM